MHPIILKIGSFELRSYGVAMAVAFLLNIWFSARRAKKERIDPDIILGLAFWVIIGTVVGGRLLFVITTWKDYFAKKPLEALALWHGGLVFYGGFLGSILAIWLYVRVYRKKWVLPVLDVIAPFAGLGYAIHRTFGCFLNGCCYGAPTDLPWGVQFPPNHPAHELYGAHAHVHPTQLYEAINGLILFYFLIFWRDTKRKAYGELSGLFLMIYAAIRFLVEFVRGDPVRGYWGALSTSQWLSIPIFLGGVLLFWYARRKGLVVAEQDKYIKDDRSPFLK